MRFGLEVRFVLLCCLLRECRASLAAVLWVWGFVCVVWGGERFVGAAPWSLLGSAAWVGMGGIWSRVLCASGFCALVTAKRQLCPAAKAPLSRPGPPPTGARTSRKHASSGPAGCPRRAKPHFSTARPPLTWPHVHAPPESQHAASRTDTP